MKKLPVVFFLILTASLFPLFTASADQPAEIPPPPDIETTSPPPIPTATDSTTAVTVPPPPMPAADNSANATAQPPDISVPPPPMPASDTQTTPAKPEAPTMTPVPPPSDTAANSSAAPAINQAVEATPAPPPAETKASKRSASKHSKKSKKPSQPESSPAVEAAAPKPTEIPKPAGPNIQQLVTAYKYAYELYAARQFEKSRDLFKKIAMVTDEPTLKSNSLYYYSQCAFRTEDYIGCVKGLRVLVNKVPDCAAIKKGFVTRFCVYLIDQSADLQTNWDYFRYQVPNDENGNAVWKESIPPGPKIKRINFRLGFGLYNVLHAIQPDSPEDAAAKQKLQRMLDAPLTVLWVDEKAPKTIYGHSADFLSLLSTNEKKHFSNVICERMFFNFQTEYFYKFLDMHDDVRNLKPRFVAVNKMISLTPETVAPPPPAPNTAGGPITTAISTEEDPNKPLTLNNLLHVAGYYPWLDSYSNTIEAAPTDLNL